MIWRLRPSAFALALACGWAMPASAQDAEAISRELAAMRAQMEQMAERIDTLESQLAAARAEAAAARPAAAGVEQTSGFVPEKPSAEIAWKGAPQLESEGGWSFKPRGRLQVDAGAVNAPARVADDGQFGFSTELRRAYLGFEGTIPGGFGYRLEADFANSSVDLADVYITYEPADSVTLTVGYQKPFWGLEEMTSDLFTSMIERAAFTSAFGFERRVGISAAYAGKFLLVQGGVFTDDAQSLGDDANKSWSADGRIVLMPELGGGRLHLGVSAHLRDANGSVPDVRYRARPGVHTTDLRPIDTGAFAVTGERGFGAEAAYVRGRFHAAAESHWLTARRAGLPDPTFKGGYAEAGFFLTPDDTRGYRNGTFDRVKPARPVDKGGIGAIQLNLRYDYLDLSDAGIVGGKQDGYLVSLIWTPTDYTRIMMNYARLQYDNPAAPSGTGRDYGVDAFGMQAQVDF